MVQQSIGIMTGTSCDGIDMAHIETDGYEYINVLKYAAVAFKDTLRQDLLTLGQRAKTHGKDILNHPQTAKIIKSYTKSIIHAVNEHFDLNQVDVLGFHGQTILHKPSYGFTIQIGNGQMLANETGCKVIADFRSADILAGGQGAPFAPLYHRALMRKYAQKKPAIFTNIGGVANVTYYDDKNDVILGWDTGMGNGLIDFLCQKYFNVPYDENGALALQGQVHQERLEYLCSREFFALKPPKSLDRNEFNISVFDGLSPHDAIATATAFSAETILLSDKFCPKPPEYRVISGGGVYNQTLMDILHKKSKCPVITSDILGSPPLSVEAECFAWLGVRALKNLPLSLPVITGAKYETTGGVLYKPL